MAGRASNQPSLKLRWAQLPTPNIERGGGRRLKNWTSNAERRTSNIERGGGRRLKNWTSNVERRTPNFERPFQIRV